MKKLISAVIMCTLALTYVTCSETCQWTQYLANPERTGYIACDGPDVPEILWKTNISGQVGILPIIIVGDTLLIVRDSSYIPPKPSSLVQMNLFTGDLENQMDAEQEDPFYSIFSDGIDVYLEGRNDVWRIDADQTLEFITSIPLKRCKYRCHPIILEDKIVYPTTPLFCFSRPDFTVLWSTDSVLPDHTNTKIVNAAANESYVFVILEQQTTKEFYALHVDTGEIAWSCITPSNMFSIAVDGSIVFIGGDALCALDTDTGNPLWEVTPQEYIYANLMVGPAYIFAADHGNRIYAIDKTTGKVVWETEGELNTGWIFLAGGGRFLYCSAGHGERSKISCFSTQDGTKVWEYTFDQEIHTHPILAQGILVVALLRGDVYAFATDKTGNEPVPPSTPPESEPPPLSELLPESPEPFPTSHYYILLSVIVLTGIFIIFFKRKKDQQ